MIARDVDVRPTHANVVRHTFAVILILVLTLGGVGRSIAAVQDDLAASLSVPGVVAPICHSGGQRSDRTDPTVPTHHDCCEECTLCAPVIISGASDLPVVTRVAHEVVRVAVVAWTVRLSRARSPRQSQGPPAA